MAIITQNEAVERANLIRDETIVAANTCLRVGSLFRDMVDSMWPDASLVSHVADTVSNPHRVSIGNLVAGTLDELNQALTGANLYSVAQVDSLLEGYVPTSRTLTAGAGLVGGGSLAEDRAFAVGATNTTILVDQDGIRVGTITNTNVADGTLAPAKLSAGSNGQVLTVASGVAAWTSRSNSDYPAFLMLDGTRPMTGALNMGGQQITNVGNVDGVDVSAHASRHAPNGSDQLGTAAPVAIGTALSAGSANTFARSDHIHTHGDQAGGSLHALATAVSNGFIRMAGDLGGAATEPRVYRLWGASIPQGSGLTVGHVLQVTGAAALSYGLVSATNIADGAVGTGKLAAGAANTVLGSNGSAASWTPAPTVNSLVASSYLAVGSTPAASGLLRVPFNANILVGRTYEGADSVLLKVTSAGDVQLGPLDGMYEGASNLVLRAPTSIAATVGGNLALGLTSSVATLYVPERINDYVEFDSISTEPDKSTGWHRLFSRSDALVAQNHNGSHWDLSPADTYGTEYPFIRLVRTRTLRAQTGANTQYITLGELKDYLSDGQTMTLSAEFDVTVRAASPTGSQSGRYGCGLVVLRSGSTYTVSPVPSGTNPQEMRSTNPGLSLFTCNSSYSASTPTLRWQSPAFPSYDIGMVLVVTGQRVSSAI